jgi:hypothetical protein
MVHLVDLTNNSTFKSSQGEDSKGVIEPNYKEIGCQGRGNYKGQNMPYIDFVSVIILLDFGIVPIVWYHLFFIL